MSVQGLDKFQIEKNSRTIEELKATFLALKETVQEFFNKYPPIGIETDEDKKKMHDTFNDFYINNLNLVRGVDIYTNLNIGRVILTKYAKDDKPKRWEFTINEINDSKSS